MAKNKQTVKTKYGRIELRGHLLNINLRIGAGYSDGVPVPMRLSLNLETGAVVGDTLSQLAFLDNFVVPMCDSFGLLAVPEGDTTRQASKDEWGFILVHYEIRTFLDNAVFFVFIIVFGLFRR